MRAGRLITPANDVNSMSRAADNATALLGPDDDYINADDSSEDEQLRDRLLPQWVNRSILNNANEQFIKQRGYYLWAFGENEMRALAVQKKEKQINGPLVSDIPLKADKESGEGDDFVVEIASADEHSACVTRKGRVFTTGHNQHQKLGINNDILLKQNKFTRVTCNLDGHRVTKVACSFFHTMALTAEGRVFVWGGTLHGKTGLGEDQRKKGNKFEPQELQFFKKNRLRVLQISCGQYHSLAIAQKQRLNSRPQLYSWGDQKYYQCGHGETIKDIEEPKKVLFFEKKSIQAVVAGQYHTLALTSDNELYSWGRG